MSETSAAGLFRTAALRMDDERCVSDPASVRRSSTV